MKIVIPKKVKHFSIGLVDLIVTISGHYMFVMGDPSSQFKYDLIDLKNFKVVNSYPSLYSMSNINVEGTLETIRQVVSNDRLMLTMVSKEDGDE